MGLTHIGTSLLISFGTEIEKDFFKSPYCVLLLKRNRCNTNDDCIFRALGSNNSGKRILLLRRLFKILVFEV